MEAVKKFKLLVCGDSYMALDARLEWNNMHWSSKLPKHMEIHNWAQAGASNTSILRQLQNALLHESFDGIVLGFTSFCRLEVGKKITTVHPWITQEQKELDKLYRKNIDLTMELFRNIAIAEYTVLLARKHSLTVFSLNELDAYLFHDEYVEISKIIDLRKEQMPMMLTGHKEFGDPPKDHNQKPRASFHVADPQVHINYANQIVKYLDQSCHDPV